MNKVKITIVGTKGLPANYGGFETLVENLTKYLGKKTETYVYCEGKSNNYYYNNAQLHFINIKANGIQSIIYDTFSLLHSVLFIKPKIIIVLGVSGALFFPVVRLFSSSKIICNIDGIEWKRQKWKSFAKCFLKLSEFFAIKFAHTVIADNEEISNYVKKEYSVNPLVIAYGAEKEKPVSKELLEKYNLTHKSYAFKVARIEPENNIELILKAFTLNQHLKLVVVGNWHVSDYSIQLKRKYSEFNNLILIDPIYNVSSLNQLRSNCKIYIHGHSAGGTNPSLVEAMAMNIPIFSFNVKFNKFTLNNLGWYYNNEEDLISLINNINELDLIGESNKIFKYYQDNYTWEKITNQYYTLILKLTTK
jgi:glycosyltransferase involved in cell wall biosynthesis